MKKLGPSRGGTLVGVVPATKVVGGRPQMGVTADAPLHRAQHSHARWSHAGLNRGPYG